MKIPPVYTITPEITELIIKIEAQRLHLISLNLPIKLKEKIERVSLLKSSLFSARIEGNPIEFADIEQDREIETKKKEEIFNIIDGAKFIDIKIKKGNVTKDIILRLHKIVMKNISSDAGHFRHEISAIFNQAGVAVYMPPPPTQILNLLNDLLDYINLKKEKFPFVAAFVAHLVFEKIHPFLDGNGRVGRLLIAAILKAKGWDFAFTIAFEEYLDEHKDKYYFYLDKGLQDANEYLLFMLTAFLQEIEKIKIEINNELAKKDHLFLPPRQEEIFNIIQDHPVCSFDAIRRRFLKVPERTLRYDLKKLLDQEIIEKTGETRGTYYRIKGK